MNSLATAPREQLTVSVEEGAAMLGISPRHLRTLIARDEVPCLRLGRRVVLSIEALRRLASGASDSGR